MLLDFKSSGLFRNFLVTFRAASSFVSISLVSFERLAPVFSNSLVPFERSVPCSQILWSCACDLLLFSQIPLFLSLVSVACFLLCSLFSNSLVSFVVVFGFFRFRATWSGLLLDLKPSSLFRTVSSLFSNCLGLLVFYQIMFFERSALLSQNFKHLSRGLLLVLKFSSSFRAAFLLVLKFSSFFRSVCSLFSNSLVSMEHFALCVLSRLVLFDRFAPSFLH